MLVLAAHPTHVTHPISDGELIHRLRQGDLDALGALYDRYSSLVYTTALNSLGDVASAEDLTQDVFLILMNQHSYDPARGSLRSYLSLLTRSRAIDRLRAQSTQHKYLNQWQTTEQSFDSIPEDCVSDRERRTLVRNALSQLTEQQQEVLELSYYQGQSQSEIAKSLGVPLGTVKSWARRGLLKLRSHLQDQLRADQP